MAEPTQNWGDFTPNSTLFTQPTEPTTKFVENSLATSTTIYDDPNTTYDSISMYYDGYNTNIITPSGRVSTLWS